MWSVTIRVDAQGQSCVNSSTWPIQGGFYQWSGYLSHTQGTPPDVEAVMMPPGQGGTNNFNFVGRLQDLASFQVDYEVYCAGTADGIYFYFGAIHPPYKEWDPDCRGFLLTNNILESYWGGQQMLVSYHRSMNVMQYTPFRSTLASWIPMRVVYSRSGSSIEVSFWAQGNLKLTTTVNDASAWLAQQSGMYWGIGARNGALLGSFSFRRLALQASDCTNLGLQCLPGSSSDCQLDYCLAGTYSTTPGIRRYIVRP
jgi:hypothetical protein